MKNKVVARFYNRCLLKSMLIDLNTQELIECIEDGFDFDSFLSIVIDLISNEQEFLMLKDSFVFKVICVISEHSNIADESTRDLINSLFEYFKKILNFDIYNKNELILNYKTSYENAIGCSVDDTTTIFLCSFLSILLLNFFASGS